MGKNRKTSSWMACLIVRSGPLGASFDAKFYHTLRWNERLASCWSAPRLEFQDWLQPPACRRRQSKSLSRKNTTLEVPHMPHCRLGLWKASHHRVRSKPNSSPEPIFELPQPRPNGTAFSKYIGTCSPWSVLHVSFAITHSSSFALIVSGLDIQGLKEGSHDRVHCGQRPTKTSVPTVYFCACWTFIFLGRKAISIENWK